MYILFLGWTHRPGHNITEKQVFLHQSCCLHIHLKKCSLFLLLLNRLKAALWSVSLIYMEQMISAFLILHFSHYLPENKHTWTQWWERVNQKISVWAHASDLGVLVCAHDVPIWSKGQKSHTVINAVYLFVCVCLSPDPVIRLQVTLI